MRASRLRLTVAATDTSGAWSVEYTHFADFSRAASAPQYHLNTNPNIGTR